MSGIASLIMSNSYGRKKVIQYLRRNPLQSLVEAFSKIMREKTTIRVMPKLEERTSILSDSLAFATTKRMRLIRGGNHCVTTARGTGTSEKHVGRSMVNQSTGRKKRWREQGYM